MMDSYKITLNGRQFKKGYLIYVIRLTDGEGNTFYYIGQTGDRNHLTARPPFRRLAGHLEDQKSSTQNQLYKGIVEQILNLEINPNEKYSSEVKDKVSDYLENSTIEMEVFNVIDFPREIDREQHKINVRKVEDIEKNLVQMAINAAGKSRVLNKKVHSPSGDDSNSDVASKIFKAVFVK
jgi:hypothetical protein